nr:EOG090X0IS7 [Lepidurus arcticus]
MGQPNNGRLEDSDGEHDHEDMDHSSNNGESDKNSMDSDSSEGSDSDDSSEMDEIECERRRGECTEDLTDLERQFFLLREQLYRERIAQVEHKLVEIVAGRGSEYQVPLSELQESLRRRTEVSGVLRQYRLVNIQNKSEAEELAARQDFESRKALLVDSIRDSLNEKIRRLEEDRNHVDMEDMWEHTEAFTNYGQSEWQRKEERDRRRKPVTVTGPYIVYMLNETDIMEDWTTIRKALAAKRNEARGGL